VVSLGLLQVLYVALCALLILLL